MNCIKIQKGIILPVVLIFFSFLMLLGVTFVTISGFQVQQSSTQNNRTQAYYLAKSSSEVIADYLVEYPKSHPDVDLIKYLTEFSSKKLSMSIEGNIVDIRFNLNGNTFLIISSSVYDGEETTVSVKLKVINGTINIIQIDNDEVIVFTDIPGKKSNYEFIKNNYPVFNGVIVESNLNNYPIYWEDLDESKLVAKSQAYINSKKIDENSIFYENNQNSHININSTIVIDMKQGNRILAFDILNVNASIELINTSETSVLYLYIRNGLTIGNGIKVFSQSNMNKIKIFSTGNISLSNKSELYGSVFLKHADFSLNEHASFMGLIYAPTSTVFIGNHNKLSGTVVTNTILPKPNTGFTYIGDLNYFFNIGKTVEEIKPKIIYDDNPWN